MIRLTLHAAEAMQTRRIPLAWVEATLEHPDWTGPDPRSPDRTRAYKAIPAFENRVLRVVYRLDGADIGVVTVRPDRNAKS
jgi:hypothetical protein